MSRRPWRLAAVLAASAALVVLLGACGHAGFTGSATPDVAKAARTAGATVTASGTAETRYPGGTGAPWYQVDRKGASGGLLVGVLTFDTAAARDAAYTQVQFRAGRLPSTVVYTWGDAVVQISQIDDWGLLQDVARAMEAAGAK